MLSLRTGVRGLWIAALLAGTISGCKTHPRPHLNEKEYQDQIAARRIGDIHAIAALIEEYHDKTGRWPLDDHPILPAQVQITRGKLDKKYTTPPRREKVAFLPYAEFEKEMKKVLGDGIDIPMDPQDHPYNFPNWYQYSTDGQDYYVAANLFYKNEYTAKIDEFYHKYSVGSFEGDDRSRIRRFRDIPPKEIRKYEEARQRIRAAEAAAGHSHGDSGMTDSAAPEAASEAAE